MRLNKQIKEQIVKAAIAATTINDRLTKCDEEMQVVLRALAIDSVKGNCSAKKYKELCSDLEAHITDFVEESSHYGLNVSKGSDIFQSRQRIDVTINGLQYGYFDFMNADATETVNVITAYRPRFSSENPNAAKFVKIHDEIKAISVEQENLKANLDAMVNSFKTVKDLIKNWPESEAYIPTSAAIAHLPVLLCADLNAMMKNAGVAA